MEISVLNILTGGYVGGIQTLCKSLAQNSLEKPAFCFLFKEGIIYDEIRSISKTYSLAELGKKKVTYKRIKKLIDIAKNYEFIVVHNGEIVIRLYYIMLKMVFPQKKFILMAHSCFEKATYFNHRSCLKNKISYLTLKKVLEISDRIIFVSNAGKESYQSNYDIEDKKCRVIYNGTDLKIHHRDSNSFIKAGTDTFNIVYIGRLAKVKGVDLLIEAIALLKDNYQVSLEIVGDGMERKNLEDLSSALSCQKSIRFYGMRRDIDSFLRNADIFVYPSIWQEVFGLSVVEAMSFGLPCVVNPVGGLPEIVRNGENGFLSKEISAKGIADAIEQVICSYYENNIGEIVENCYKTAKKFNIHNMINELNNCFMEMINEEYVH